MINNNRLFTLFEQLVSIDSPSFGEREICDFIKTKFSESGIAFYEDDAGDKIGGSCGNLYAYIDGALDLPPLLFCAHMDTVEPSRGKRMQINKNGVITSDSQTVLGADDCAGIAAILEALATLKETGAAHRPVEILFTVAEEPYCVGIQHMDFEKIRSDEAYVFDLSGSVGGAAYQAPTIISFKAVFIGHSAHAGFAPEKGLHAIKAAAEAVLQIPCGRVENATVNIGTISGGTADNIVPDSCVLTGEIRSLSDEEAHRQLRIISKSMQNAANKSGVKVSIESVSNCTAYRTDTKHTVVKRFESACLKTGLKSHLCQTFGGSDNNYMAGQGIKGIVVATAMNNCHSCTEYTTKQELERAASIAFELMCSKE